jgi:D-3-phosphoglycerate dehydrogenase / 2-oxoglutarate reductase
MWWATTWPTPDAILVRSANDARNGYPEIGQGDRRAGAGTNNIPVEEAMSERGVVVFNAPGANANAVKELVIAGMLMGARNLLPGAELSFPLPGGRAMKRCTSRPKPARSTSPAIELPGRTLGVVGLGAIGVVHRRCGHRVSA